MAFLNRQNPCVGSGDILKKCKKEFPSMIQRKIIILQFLKTTLFYHLQCGGCIDRRVASFKSQSKAKNFEYLMPTKKASYTVIIASQKALPEVGDWNNVEMGFWMNWDGAPKWKSGIKDTFNGISGCT